ncbi:MBL fold metallo-hydrolase [Anaerotignum sp. MB30-C6]|uniref:MBL fold metallo-hydrolase n=1 Tax=Anaerotignum sp. MB30-C6 TaxID=3070814 RepID=UPI0027DE9191|nr:MBL fold metallo-hydrolase [Anaerotignum sp. MB30-C6]WMI80854.1 MBL fold metallo-hydrolase [Anaerotignum sp. MB30-C6]
MMRVTVLMDNHTDIDVYYLGEPAVSYWIEADGKSFLFDLGYSSAFLKNAKDMAIDVTKADGVILSHGHNDHTGGLVSFIDICHGNKPKVICHPHTLISRNFNGLPIGSPLDKETLQQHLILFETKEPYWLTENLVFLGEVPRELSFEKPYPIGTLEAKEGDSPDMILDDTALAYSTEQGIYIITGCSHAGICNIIEYAKKVLGKEKVLGILGGFHLFDIDKRTEETISYIAKEQVQSLYPCHCTSFRVRAALDQQCPVEEVGVGLVLNWE